MKFGAHQNSLKESFEIFEQRPLRCYTIEHQQALNQDHYFHSQIAPGLSMVVFVDVAEGSSFSCHCLKMCLVRDVAPFEVVHEIMCDDIGFSSQSGIAIELVQADKENASIYFSARQVAEPG